MNNIPNIIAAKRCLWCEGEPSNIALETLPRINERYWVSVSNAINLSVGEASWLLYESALVVYNDYSEASEFDATRFCFVKIIARLRAGNTHTIYRVQVQHLLSLADVIVDCAEQEFHPTWNSFLSGFGAWKDDSIKDYGAYKWLSVSLQSDCGLDCVMMQHEARLYACLVVEWGFGYDEVFGGRFRLPETVKMHEH